MSPKIVFIVSRFPYPLIKGDKLRAYHQIVELSKTCDVYLLALSDASISNKSIQALEPFCKEIHTHRLPFLWIVWNVLKYFLFTKKPIQVGYFFNPGIHKKILRAIEKIQPDHIYCQLIRTSEYVRNIKDIPKTLDYMDALSAGMERRAEQAPELTKFIFNTEAKRLKVYEHDIFKSFDRACIISASDRDLIFHYSNEDIEILPNGIDAEYFHDLKLEKKYDLLFTGNMSYPPNIQSARYLVENIMPLIWEKRPETTLLIAGANPDRSIRKFSSNKVSIQGWVDDIRVSYSSSKIFIAPMLIGSGMQNKLLEAMAMKMPCITSKLANQALGAKEDLEILVGYDENQYAQHVLNLFNQPELSNQIAEKGYNFVTNHYHWTKSNQILLKTLNLLDGASQKRN